MSRPRRMLVVGAIAILGAGVGIVLLVWLVQRSVVFQPDATPVGPADQASEAARDLTLHTEDGLELEAWLLPPDPQADRETAVLYAPGNAGNRLGRLGIAQELTDRGFTVLLRSPFPDFAAVANEHYGILPVGLLLRDRFPVVDHLTDSTAQATVPITVLSGTGDTIVPSALSAEVAAAADQAGTLHREVVLDGVGHNDSEMFGAPVADALEDLADSVVPAE